MAKDDVEAGDAAEKPAKSKGEKPSKGRIVQYCLRASDAEAINRRRTSGAAIAERIAQQVLTPDQEGVEREDTKVEMHAKTVPQWPLGAQAHIGNEAQEGQTFPMMIVAVWEDAPTTSAVNGQVFLDGNDVFWATSVSVGEGPGTYSWPARS